MSENLIEIDAARQRLRIGRTTLWRLRKTGMLPTITRGRRKFIPEADLDRYLAESLDPITPDPGER